MSGENPSPREQKTTIFDNFWLNLHQQFLNERFPAQILHMLDSPRGPLQNVKKFISLSHFVVELWTFEIIQGSKL